MIELRARDELGLTRLAGLEALHHFSFGQYQDAARGHWGALTTLNHNLLEPRTDMPPHPIDGVDILTIVRKGVIAHRVNMDAVDRTLAGEVQLLCPGRGIVHAQSNPGAKLAEFVEIRLRMETVPERVQRRVVKFPGRGHTGRLALLASGFSEDRPAMLLHSRARVFGARLPARGALDYILGRGRRAYVMTLGGSVEVNGQAVGPLEGAAIASEREIRIESRKFAEILLIDVR
ncbi:pirin family protein [Sphingomonas sp. QA11]|uniref:pirin family protein n=1 Tax=Sphingomonas sp. QA11 TaxID=2950605 RepID=UPI00234B8126|nr:pirin family protein [Sphingomonas sp. QA11]WCM25122.1 pirin family protein [Sphingomonas sp. QA11]